MSMSEMIAMQLGTLRTLEQLLSQQIAAESSAVLVKKCAAVREQIEDAEAALTRQQILEAIV